MKERVDFLSERLTGDAVSKIPVETLKKNPLLKNKGQVFATPEFPPNTLDELKRCPMSMSTNRSKADYKGYLGTVV